MLTAFPVDNVTLALLRESCACGDDGQSHLFDFLDFGTVVADRTQLADNVVEVPTNRAGHPGPRSP